MPVLPLVASRMTLPAVSWPDNSAARIMRYAARSFTEPPGLNHSALAKMRTWGNSWPIRSRGMSGVLPIVRSSASVSSEGSRDCSSIVVIGIKKAGGDEGIRTPDLLVANEALYQLSYIPNLVQRHHSKNKHPSQATKPTSECGMPPAKDNTHETQWNKVHP